MNIFDIYGIDHQIRISILINLITYESDICVHSVNILIEYDNSLTPQTFGESWNWKQFLIESGLNPKIFYFVYRRKSMRFCVIIK